MRYLTLALLFAVLGLATWQWLGQEKMNQLEAQVAELTSGNQQLVEALKVTQDKLLAQQLHAKQLESQTLKGLAGKANGAFFKGLESLLNSVGEEVERAKKSIEQQQSTPAPKSTPLKTEKRT